MSWLVGEAWCLLGIPDCIGDHVHLCAFRVGWAQDATLTLWLVVVWCGLLGCLNVFYELGSFSHTIIVILASSLLFKI